MILLDCTLGVSFLTHSVYLHVVANVANLFQYTWRRNAQNRYFRHVYDHCTVVFLLSYHILNERIISFLFSKSHVTSFFASSHRGSLFKII